MAAVSFSGYLSQDPELRDAGNSKVLKLRIPEKVGFGERQKTNWFAIDVWGKQGEALANILRKGSYVSITGELAVREYESQGEKRTSLDVSAWKVDLGPKTGDTPAPSSAAPERKLDKDEIPF